MSEGDIYSFSFCSQKCAECSRTIIGGTSNNRPQTHIKLVWIRMRSNWSNIRSWTVGSIQLLLWIPNIPVKNPENNYWTPKNVRLGRWGSFWTWSVFNRVNKAVPLLSHVIQGAPLSHRQLTNIYRLHPRIWGDVPLTCCWKQPIYHGNTFIQHVQGDFKKSWITPLSKKQCIQPYVMAV